jgi:predicted secreted acid phosphatase
MRTAACLTSIAVLLTLALVPAAGATDPTGQSAAEIREYYSSGDWGRAVSKQVKKAKRWLKARTEARDAPKKPALVLDIDETSLDNYPCLDASGGLPYDGVVYAQCVVAYDAPAIRPVRSLFRRARELGVSVFFITGRPQPLRDGTLRNLRAAGFTGKYELFLEPDGYDEESAVPYKSGARRKIQRRGFRIIANVGDQRSDLKGGYSERTYKLPNPIYLTP